MVLELEDSLNGCKIMSSGKLSLQQVFFFCCREMAKTKTTSAEQLKKCPFCSFKSRSHSEWKDHMAECYETRHFCRRCDYSTDKKVNYIRHLKRNHPDEVEKGQGSQQSDNAEGIKSSEDSLSRDLHEDESSDEEEWLSQEPDITIDEEPGTSGPSPCEKAVDPTVRKRTQPMPVYTPDRCKTPRLDDKTNDPPCKVADKAVQTDPVVYTKSIKTTTIVREHGRKTITVKREKML